MANRRNYTNQHGAFVPTETQALENLTKKPVKEEEEEIVVKRHQTILTEEDMKELDKNRKRKSFAEFIKEELEKEEEPVKVPVKEREVLSEEEKKRRKAEYMKRYYAGHKDVFARANKRHYQKKKEAKANCCLGEKRSYTDIDLIRLVKVDGKIVGWYRPDGKEQNDEK